MQYIRRQKEKKQAHELKIKKQKDKELKLTQIWQSEILPDWDHTKTTARAREAWTEGIPPKIRQTVWFRAVGNKILITRDLFSIMAERGRKLSELLQRHQKIENGIVENGGNP
jgi:hypothetical protein